MEKLLALLLLFTLLSQDCFSQWTNSANTIHDGRAQIKHNESLSWESHVPSESGSKAGGISFNVLNSEVAVLGYDYSDLGFYFGETTGDYNNSIVRIKSTDSDVGPTGGGILSIGKSSQNHLTFDANEIQAFTSSGPGRLYLNNVGGKVVFGKSNQPSRFYKNLDKIGIGTSTPKTSLHLIGNNEMLRMDGPLIKWDFYDGALQFGYLEYRNIGKELNLISTGNASTVLEMGNTPGLFISKMGDVGVGTAMPLAKLDVMGTVLVSGELTFTSDKRLKKKIQELHNATRLLSNLNPVAYYYRSNEYKKMKLSDKMRFGLLAQEVRESNPELIASRSQAYAPDEKNENYLSVKYVELVSILIQSGQEQLDQIEALQVSLASQLSRIEQVK